MRTLLTLLCLLTPVLMAQGIPAQANESEPQISQNAFNAYVIAMLKSYPTDGTHQYYWPTQGAWKGNTRDLLYRGSLFAQGDTYGRCYCCGLTFEVFFRAYEKWCQDQARPFIIKDFDTSALNRFLRQWFGADGNMTTLQNAVVGNGLGQAIPVLHAEAGDFIQLWRHNGSGHSVIFIAWEKNYNGQVIGMKYWSTQKISNGIGYNTEYFGTTSGVDINKVYVARVVAN